VMQTCAVDYRTAYEVVGTAVRMANAAGLRGIDLDGAMLDAAAIEYRGRPLGLTGHDLGEVLDPRAVVETRTALGGAAPHVVEQMAGDCIERAERLRAVAHARRDAFRRAEQELIAEAAAFLSAAAQGAGR
jgi:argininosuccinate lyase